MKKITIREIIKATGAQMIALGDMEEALNKEIWYVTQDSRETKEGVLFVARVGEVRDGHDFLPQCFANGVTACLSQKVVAPTNGAIVLLVPDTGKALIWRLITEACLTFPLFPLRAVWARQPQRI